MFDLFGNVLRMFWVLGAISGALISAILYVGGLLQKRRINKILALFDRYLF